MKLIILFFLFILCSSRLFGQYVFDKQFYSSINNSENEFSRANAVIQTSDSNFLFVGTGANTSKMSAIKSDKYGNINWQYSEDFNDYNIHYFNDIIESNDNNFIIGATVADSIVGFSNAGILKLDKNTGDTIWLKTYGINTSSEYCYSIKKTTNNGFVLSGVRYSTDSLNVMQSDVYLVKTDSLGNLEWEKTFGGAKYEWGQSIELTDDGGYVILGITTTFGAGGVDMYCIKTDSVGNLLWEKTFGSYWDDYGLSVCKLQDGNFALVGNTHLNSTKIAANIIKINPEGEIIWQKKFVGNYDAQEFTGVKQSTTGEIVLCGNSQSDTIKSSFYGIVKLLNENDGSVIWERQYSYIDKDSTDHYFYGMDLCNDGGFVFAGMTRNWNQGEGPGNAMWVVKTDCMGNDSIWDNAACPLPDTIAPPKPFNLYPNPTNGSVTVDYFIPQNAENQSVSFYDATGKLVQKVDFTGEGQIQLNIDCSEFINGFYTCTLISNNNVVDTLKLIILK